MTESWVNNDITNAELGLEGKPEHHRVYIDNIVIERVNCNKFIGVRIDSKLSWSDHVSYIRHTMSKNLSVMHRVKWLLLNKSALYMIYSTLVLPYISYCCEIWGNTYKTRIQPLYHTKAGYTYMQSS